MVCFAFGVMVISFTEDIGKGLVVVDWVITIITITSIVDIAVYNLICRGIICLYISGYRYV